MAHDVTGSNWRGSQAYRKGVQETVKLRDQAIAASSVGIVIADARLPDMPLIYVNPAFERITGYSDAEVLGYNCRFLQGKDTSQPAVDQLRAAIKAGENCTVTLLNYRKDGTPFWNELTLSPIYDDGNNLTHFVGIQSDISDRIKAEQALRLEQEKSERLLLNILPKPIVDQLKQFEGSLAQQFTEATILFADIVGFTQLSAQMSPLELLNLLNQIFSVFDKLAEKHGIEKIKTIGDAYMAVAGLPVANDHHAEAIAQMALDMQQAIQQFKTPQGEPFQIRIGINTGLVVAGVIGIKKFSYDLWGDAVNVASRMESSGLPGKIQVTAATKERLQDKYIFEQRGVIAVKGKGEMINYWLVGKQK
ncbi:MAG: adenylate/guanylate cyclase domain-containing protein [Coleofasciculus sp.]